MEGSIKTPYEPPSSLGTMERFISVEEVLATSVTSSSSAAVQTSNHAKLHVVFDA
jgi:hypothetical protein